MLSVAESVVIRLVCGCRPRKINPKYGISEKNMLPMVQETAGRRGETKLLCFKTPAGSGVRGLDPEEKTLILHAFSASDVVSART